MDKSLFELEAARGIESPTPFEAEPQRPIFWIAWNKMFVLAGSSRLHLFSSVFRLDYDPIGKPSLLALENEEGLVAWTED